VEEDGERCKGEQLKEDRGIYERRRASDNQNGGGGGSEGVEGLRERSGGCNG
jgi:hypothetical protein